MRPLIPAILLGTLAAGLALAQDTAPPTIDPRVPLVDEQRVVFRARILDDSGVKSATLWLKTAREAEFRSKRMKTTDEAAVYEVVVDKGSIGGSRIEYYFEAVDGAGNPPARHGDRTRPHALVLSDAATDVGESGGGLRAVLLAALVALIVILVRRLRLRPGTRARRPGGALTRGGPRVSLAEASPQQVVEELFWFRLLAPVAEREPVDRERMLRELASRAHAHPTQGRRFFPISKLRERLARVGRIDRGELQAKAEELAGRISRQGDES